MKILTWSNGSNNGAFQKPIGTNIFSDMLTTKPTFSFTYTDLQYIEQNNTFKVDGVEMTASQKTEILSFIGSVVPPLAWNVAVKTQEIDAKYSEAVSLMVGSVTPTELATWRKQEEQAKAWNADNTFPTPMIDGILAGRAGDYTKQAYVNKIILNATSYENAYAPVLGRYLLKLKEISLATTATAVDAIVWGA